MIKQLLNIKVLTLSGTLMLLAVCDSAQANYDSSYCNATGNVSIQNINLKGGQHSPGDVLQDIVVPIQYTCVLAYSSVGTLKYSATVDPSGMKPAVDALKSSGLAMDILVQENGSSPVTFSWKDIKNGFSGWPGAKAFGQQMWTGNYSLSGTLTLHIFVDTTYKNTFSNINIPPGKINILPYAPAQPGISVRPPSVYYTPLTVSAFNLRIIPDNSGRVIISPSVVNLGHFYTEYKDTLVAREVPFTVTAQQNTGTQSPFVAPLAIEFQTGGLTLADGDSSVTLANTKGEANGFRLSVVDEAGHQVKFNTKEKMGDINLDNDSGGKIIKQYKAKVEPIPGATIKTGKFSAAMTVVVTYI
ncbi:adhesion protein [Salmonella enterica subsp. enterica serovar Oranienburg]|uniref:Fimbrial protein n=1 Tax=Salmonella enterica TaxID=28901 RepID=A0A744GCR9_SALER|nr:adhesion protein [Salmonella enterica subsp. enterica serovar Oranienburg]HAF1421001.1 fimbrial protein [Salmonella enterica]EBY8948052.1 adhesion protein [Salmonella enterica subsp. enterica serovar Oranienburg]HAF2207052.1 fimbrial protein [Salmonella enterica]HAF2376407.1 fimbrial protein [Salmonella enterica]